MNPDPNKKARPIGGILHTYQKYDPKRFPSPTSEPPDLVSPLMNYWMTYGSARDLTPEQLARAVRIDPSQFSQLGPSLDAIRQMLLERKRKILSTYETDTVLRRADDAFKKSAQSASTPKKFAERYQHAVQQQQIFDLERLWYAVNDDTSRFARDILQTINRLGEKYEVEELASKYEFTGKQSMTVDEAIEIKQELEMIDQLLKQIEEARENAQIAIIDLDALAEFVDEANMESLQQIRQTIEDYVNEMAKQQGVEFDKGQFKLSPQAMRIFQGKLLSRIFSELQASRTGRHQGPIVGEGAVELQQTKPYEFGDSVTQLDIPQTFINAMIRDPQQSPIRINTDDIEVHRTRNTPKCATVVIMDMSGSMRYEGQYVNVKRMALAMEGLIRSEYPGDYLQFIEMATFAKQCRSSEIIDLMPKPVTLHDPWVRLKVDMSQPNVSEMMVHPHFTNIQHSLRLARQLLSNQNTPNRQVILITDGLPTAHFEESNLFLLYPPDPLTERATMREGLLCQKDGITINLFLIPSWSQSEEDIRFAYNLAESTKGRVIFTAGRDLDRFVIWDYIQNKRELFG